ncbi:Type I phosphodiesterase/nucleotide pyrophosphatase [Pleurostoma richardsiae]|uniref:Type I phosphodiesterase/nucleotide pyrophosphatase n=1 Tax=Pleurostoma richardsiae TaxID=41990 RepID=A0AA38VYM9_9PEZI|nr:Type I phosphodiesterase/nucleotide pyrophosphatase [Pleurostoma richardsiae]
MPLQPLEIPESRDHSLLSPVEYDPDASSIRSDQDSDSDDDERQLRARNSRELRAHDRIVLLEEEETDQLVIEARRRQERERERRGSNLPIPNPLRLLSRRLSETSRSRSRSASAGAQEPTGPLIDKRKRRRERRRQKKERLLADAQHGEDGELMFEMEEGGMKEGSSTGSSDREDSDEVDRRGLKLLGDAKNKRRRHWCRWLLIHTMIAIAFTILVLLAWKLSIKKRAALKTQQYVSNGTALFAPTTLIISLDGFRADFLKRGLTPRLNAFIKEGVSPLYMLPAFPSVTFPNHYTLATGLHPESHGVVGNSFWDPELQAEFFYTDPSRSMDPKWWKGEPFWVTAERQGIRAAVHMWPGSEAHIAGVEPSFLDTFNGKEKLSNKVNRIFEFLDKPGMEDPKANVADMRPQLIAAYVPNVDADGHKYGPNSTEIRATIQDADTMLDDIFKGLELRNLTNIVNVIVVSDHGMATTDVSRLMQLEDLVDTSKIAHIDGWPLYGLRPKDPNDLQGLYDGLAEKAKSNPNFEVYLRDVNMPERYHFSHNDRIAPLWIIPKTGWAIVKKDDFDIEEAKAKGFVYHPRGLHGYDHEHPLMRAIFIARGPAFPHDPNSEMAVFQNIEVYNILCDSVGLKPMPNNGTLRLPLQPIGVHDPDETLETPPDPVDTATYQQAASVTAAPSPDPSPSLSGVVGVDPVEVVTSAPAVSLGVDPVTDIPSPTTSAEPAPVESPSTDQPGSDGGDEKEGSGSKVQDFWGWFTGKLDEWWDKVTGSKSDSGSHESD